MFMYAWLHLVLQWLLLPFCFCCLGTLYAIASFKLEQGIMAAVRQKKDNKIKRCFE